MRQIVFLFLLAAAAGCTPGQQGKETERVTFSETMRRAVDALTDSAATWQQICDAVVPASDSLIAAMLNTDNTRKRVHGQEWGYVLIEGFLEKYCELDAKGEMVSESSMVKILGDLSVAINQWFFDDSGDRPVLWKDHYYASNQSAEMPVSGFFHLMVDLPTENHPDPTLHIFFPQSAKGSPALIFGSSDDYVPNIDNLLTLERWHKKNEAQDGFPMYAGGGAELVEKMLHNAVVYILFESEDTPEGEPGEWETACLPLTSFQEMWGKMYNNYCFSLPLAAD